MKAVWKLRVAIAKYGLLLLMLSWPAYAETLGQEAMGRASLGMLLGNRLIGAESQIPPEKQPFFILAPSYSGSVVLSYHWGTGEGAAKKRDIQFSAFTRATDHYDEPDCAKPRIPAIFEFIKDVWGKLTYGEFAFSAKSIPSVKRLAACKTLNDLETVIPGLVSVFDEDNPHSGVWYNWFTLTDIAQLKVVLLKARNDAQGRLTSMEIWDGTLSPQKPSAIWDLPL